MSKNCKMCGTPNDDGVQFCAACGCNFDVGAAGPKREAHSPSGKAPAKTMFGVPAAGAFVPAAPVPQQPAQAPMAHVSAPMAQPGPPMARISTAPPAAQAPSQPAAHKAPAKTVFGVPGIGAPVPAQAQIAQPAQAPLASPVPMAKPVSSAPQPAAPSHAMRDKRTVLGIPAVGTESIPPPAAKPSEPQPAAPPSAAPRPETMPLEPVSKPPPPAVAPRPETRRLAPVDGADGWDDDDDEPLPRRKSSVGIIVVVATAAVVLLGAAAALYLFVLRGGGGPAAQLFPSADGRSVTVVVPFEKAPLGATVQVQGQIVQIVAGQARFDFPRDGLVVGENALPVVYVAPGASPESMTIPIFVRYKATTDLQGLATADPFFVVNFQVAPGVNLAVNGQPVQLVGNVYALKVPLSQVAAAGEGASGDSLLHKIPFSLTMADGAVEQGEHVVAIPVTKLRVDRPAPSSVVATEAVTCAGAADDGAVVTVNGAPVGVTAVGFRTSVPLPAIGKHTVTIEARAPGKAPAKTSVEVTRIQSLDAAIADWSADLDRGIDYPILARDPNAAVGKKIVLHGRIVNISTERGVTAFLLYVGDGCPAGAKCAVYVAFRGETDAGLQSMVDVFGLVRGTWDVQLEGGGQETMPALDAEFVVRSDAAKASSKKR